jgi:peptide/nickel transport system ATP-binding protein
MPELVESAPGHLVRCHLPAETRREIWLSEIKPTLEGS